ncbi:MAG: hypothetical protein K1Y36_12465 [Blastocatellia bacterium]|nr:hypothetical protein [Blastocatellia bacterium]
MALLGAIRPGTIAGLIRLLSQNETVSTLVCERGATRIEVFFAAGKIEGVEVNHEPAENGLDIVSSWSEGVYRLIKGRAERSARALDSSESSGARGHILLISRDPNLTGTCESYLEQAGYEVSVAPTDHAMEVLQQVSPSVVVLDTEPGEGELTVAEQVRTLRTIDDLPVIALTRMPDATLSRALHGLGMSSLTKPISPESLLGIVQQELQMHAMRVSRDWSELSLPADSPDIASDIVDLLLFDENLPALDAVYDKSAKLGIKIALGEASAESIALFDLFDGRHTLREVVAANPKLAKKLKFLTSYMIRTGLLDTVVAPPQTKAVIDEETGELSEVPLPNLGAVAPRIRPEQPYFSAAETILMADVLNSTFGNDAQWAKLITLGLPTAYRGALADTLRYISAVQSGFIKRGTSLAIPPLPEYELARIVMRSDLLLTAHDVEDENRLMEVVQLLRGDIWGFIFFVSLHQRSAMNYLRSLVKSVRKSFNRPFLVNLLNVGVNVEAEAIQMVEDTLEIDQKGIVGVWNIQRPESVVDMIDQLIQIS